MEPTTWMRIGAKSQDVRKWAQTGASKPSGPTMTETSTIGAAASSGSKKQTKRLRAASK